jgi:ubiquinol-cytochrome c reductase cytochrome b subunit
MLRAITSEMVNVLIVIALGSAAWVALKTQLSVVVKGAVAAAAVAVSLMMFSIDAKFWGVVVMGGAVVILFFLPWLDHCEVKSIRYKPEWHKIMYGIFVINFVVLAYLGVQPPSQIGERVSQVGTLFYFGFFLLMPWWSKIGQTKVVPARVVFQAH